MAYPETIWYPPHAVAFRRSRWVRIGCARGLVNSEEGIADPDSPDSESGQFRRVADEKARGWFERAARQVLSHLRMPSPAR